MEVQPSFDNWSSLFLLASGAGVFFGAILLLPVQHRRQNWPISLLLFAFSLLLFQYVIFWSGYGQVYPLLGYLGVCLYLPGPLLTVYLVRYGQWSNVRWLWLLFLPFVLATLGVLAVLLYIRWPELGNWAFFPTLMRLTHLLTWPFVVGALLLSMGILVFVWLRLRNQENGESGRLLRNWSGVLSGAYLAFVSLFCLYHLLFSLIPYNRLIDYLLSLAMTLTIYLIGYMAYREPSIFNGELSLALGKPMVGRGGNKENEEGLEQIFDLLKEKMEREKLYLQPGLRVIHLEDHLGIPAYLLSQAINIRPDLNFNRMVNRYRVEEAGKLLEDNPELSVKEVMYQVGFSSKAAFYSSFKDHFGATPTEFRKHKSQGSSA